MVPSGRIERPIDDYKSTSIPFTYKGMVADRRIELRINRLWACCETTSLVRNILYKTPFISICTFNLGGRLGVEPSDAVSQTAIQNRRIHAHILAGNQGLEPQSNG